MAGVGLDKLPPLLEATRRLIAWRSEPVVRRIVQWANAVSQHRTDV